jgi:GH24 family phage-related lysozyme (muramidase)
VTIHPSGVHEDCRKRHRFAVPPSWRLSTANISTTRRHWQRDRLQHLGGRCRLLIGVAVAVLALVSTAPTVAQAVPGPHSYAVTATLDGRTAKSMSNHAAPDKYPIGSTATVVCQASGPATYQGSTVWDLTEDGLWITDYYVSTGYRGFSPDLQRCKIPRTFSISRSLDGRTAKDLSNHAYPSRYAAGTRVSVECQAYGGPTYGGSYLWDRTSDGLWITDYYVSTGTSNFVQGLPRCDLYSAASTHRGPVSGLELSPDGVRFIEVLEGFRPKIYQDGNSNCTIGYGHKIHRGECTSSDKAKWGTISPEQGLALLKSDARAAVGRIHTTLRSTPLRQSEFDALVSFIYSIGTGSFDEASVKRDLTAAPPNYSAVPTDMRRWATINHRFACGLYKRRVNEGHLFSTGSYTVTSPPCPSSTKWATLYEMRTA